MRDLLCFVDSVDSVVCRQPYCDRRRSLDLPSALFSLSTPSLLFTLSTLLLLKEALLKAGSGYMRQERFDMVSPEAGKPARTQPAP